jgi:putative effector of murein hydrolase
VNTTAEGYIAPPISFYTGTVLVLVALFQTVNVTSTEQYQAWDPAKHLLHTFCRPPLVLRNLRLWQFCRELRDIWTHVYICIYVCVCVCVCHQYTRNLTKKLNWLSDQPLPLL